MVPVPKGLTETINKTIKSDGLHAEVGGPARTLCQRLSPKKRCKTSRLLDVTGTSPKCPWCPEEDPSGARRGLTFSDYHFDSRGLSGNQGANFYPASTLKLLPLNGSMPKAPLPESPPPLALSRVNLASNRQLSFAVWPMFSLAGPPLRATLLDVVPTILLQPIGGLG